MPPTNMVNSYSSMPNLIPQDIPVHLLFCTSLDFAPISKNCLRCIPHTARSTLSVLKYRKIRKHWHFLIKSCKIQTSRKIRFTCCVIPIISIFIITTQQIIYSKVYIKICSLEFPNNNTSGLSL